MSQGGASVSQRPPAQRHAKHPSVSSIPPSAPPPTKAEIERKLSIKLAGVSAPRRTPKAQVSGNESDTSTGSASLPPLLTSALSFGGSSGHFPASPVASPSTPLGGHGHGHGPLSAIAERHGSSIDMGEGALSSQLDEGAGNAAVDDDSDDNEGGVNVERGMDGERIFKTGFLIKKQERRKAWKKKWFVLRSTKLAYYKDNREYSLSRAIELGKIHSVVPVASEKQKHPFAFAIVTSERTFMVEALSAEERNDWVRAINSARTRLSEQKDEEARRAQTQTRPVAVPVPQATGDRLDPIDTHVGTWTSTVSNTTGMSVSPSASAGGYFRPAGPLSWQAGAPYVQGPPASTSSLTSHMAAANLGRSPLATAPSAASVNRRLSNPIPIQNLSVKTPTLRRNPSIEQAGGLVAAGASLSPPVTSPHFVSSDEDEPYLSDPSAAWADFGQPEAAIRSPVPVPVADPKQVILAMYLMKKSRKTTRQVWRKRWFYLTTAGITYTKSHIDSRPLTFIPITSILDVFSVDADDDDDDEGSSGPDTRSRSPPRRHTSIRTRMEPNAHPKAQDHVVRIVCAKRRYDLCAPSEEEEIKWTAAIRALIKRERARQTGGVAASSEGTGAGPGLAPPQSQSQSPAVPTITQVPPTPASIPSPVSPATLDSPSSASGRRTNAR